MPHHSLFRLSSKIYNKPHLITPQAFEVVLNYLDYRNDLSHKFIIQDSEDSTDIPDTNPDDLDDFDKSSIPVAVINVYGSLTYKPVMTLCGAVGTSYESLEDQVEEAIEAGATTIILNFASGGGEATHAFETADNIRNICTDAGVVLLGYADECACSAAYLLAVVCDELYANPSATLGSIGCVVALLDTSKAMEMEGYKRVFITSGTNKVPFDPDGSFKESFLEEIQVSVDKLNTQFTDHVAKYTGIDQQVIRNFEASCFDAEDSLANNLISGIMTNKEFVQYVVSKQGAQDA